MFGNNGFHTKQWIPNVIFHKVHSPHPKDYGIPYCWRVHFLLVKALLFCQNASMPHLNMIFTFWMKFPFSWKKWLPNMPLIFLCWGGFVPAYWIDWVNIMSRACLDPLCQEGFVRQFSFSSCSIFYWMLGSCIFLILFFLIFFFFSNVGSVHLNSLTYLNVWVCACLDPRHQEGFVRQFFFFFLFFYLECWVLCIFHFLFFLTFFFFRMLGLCIWIV